MNLYALVKKIDGTQNDVHVVGTIVCGTQGQAERKLYRANNVNPTTAKAQGYSVRFQPNKPHAPTDAL